MTWRNLSMEQERLNFINSVLDQKTTQTFVEICAQYGISRKTGYKWLDRYHLNGCEGLRDLSRAPHTNPNKVSLECVKHVIEIRKEFSKWGPKKIKAELQEKYENLEVPSTSSIANILKDHNLVKPRRLRKHVALTAPLADCCAPNDVWMYDFKGYFKTGDGKICEPLTITDGYSRYLIKCKHMKRKRTNDVWEVLEEAFYQYGLPKRMRSDNGPPFASIGVGRLSPFAIKLVKIGVIPEWIEPGCPQQNGRHERFHLTFKNEIANPPAKSLELQLLYINQFVDYYNNKRPHEAIGQRKPSVVYKPSNRKWNGDIPPVEYSNEYELRRVCKGGLISWKGANYFLSESLYGENIGIREIEVGKMGVYYGCILLGMIDLKKGFKRL